MTNEPAPGRNDGSRSALSRINDSKPASGKNNSNGKIDGFSGHGVEYAKKSRKLKGQKTSKSRKSVKSEKNSSKSWNSPNFGATKTESSFLTLKARAPFNCLRLAFTQAPIFQHFDPKCYIWIETDALGYIIGNVLSKLAFETSSNGVVTKTDLG